MTEKHMEYLLENIFNYYAKVCYLFFHWKTEWNWFL